jgi:hypothetical protein
MTEIDQLLQTLTKQTDSEFALVETDLWTDTDRKCPKHTAGTKYCNLQRKRAINLNSGLSKNNETLSNLIQN